jgi:hypothetical protein
VTDKGLTHLADALVNLRSGLGQIHLGPGGVTNKGIEQLLKARPFLRIVR